MSIGSMMFNRFFLLASVPYVGPWIDSNGEGFVRLNAGVIERSSNVPVVDFTLLDPNTLEAFITIDRYVYAKYVASYKRLEMGVWSPQIITIDTYNSFKAVASSRNL